MEQNKLACLFKSWGHSREEDADGVTVYRPSGFKFPISRGRDGLEFRPDGTLLRFDAGLDDRGRTLAGSWKNLPDDALLVHADTDRSRKANIIACEEGLLKVRWE